MGGVGKRGVGGVEAAVAAVSARGVVLVGAGPAGGARVAVGLVERDMVGGVGGVDG
eukprot:CAMPEP_0197393210 /NCGR_PEP_ID=MMETSP1165-20131217/4185_1 /TAXON_ID=284809 /ORGANISM="Chrysocystis fragilis, Strain CCMP3189" /LENGTH=55 /DNA_ID=CAMNT_0042918869 /DNA_START=129 /DNA_END=292 /DNA_ORIENTATION=+